MALKVIRGNGATPQRAVACCAVRATDDAQIDAILAWAKASLRGEMWWSKTQFREPHGSRMVHNSRQRHFKEGYWVYRFWFSRKSAAALFIIWWGQSRDHG